MYVFFVFTTRLENPQGQESTRYPSLMFSRAFSTLFVGWSVCFTELIAKKCLLCTCKIEMMLVVLRDGKLRKIPGELVLLTL